MLTITWKNLDNLCENERAAAVITRHQLLIWIRKAKRWLLIIVQDWKIRFEVLKVSIEDWLLGLGLMKPINERRYMRNFREKSCKKFGAIFSFQGRTDIDSYRWQVSTFYRRCSLSRGKVGKSRSNRCTNSQFWWIFAVVLNEFRSFYGIWMNFCKFFYWISIILCNF